MHSTNKILYIYSFLSAGFFIQSYLGSEKLRYDKLLLVNSEVGKSERLKTLMETNQLQQPQPLQLVSIAQYHDKGIKIRPIKDYINKTVYGQ